MNLIVLMAGSSELFVETGEKYPKALIEIDGEPIIKHVVRNIQALIDMSDKVVFIVNEDESQKYYLKDIINLLVPDSCVMEVKGKTSGAACTALLAVEHINDSEPLLIVNGDQIIDVDYRHVMDEFNGADADGGILIFESVHPRWSYVKIKNEKVVEAAEKKPISKNATAGFYFFKYASEFIRYTKQVIIKDANLDGNFYICPVYNEMILGHGYIKVVKIEAKQYHSLMSPDMVLNYKKFLEG